MREAIRQNRTLIRNQWRAPLQTTHDFLDAQYLFASQVVGFLSLDAATFSGHGQEVVPAAAAFHKNLFHLYAALDLTQRGMIGPARVLFRVMFEALYLGKFSLVTGDVKLVKKWLEGEPISVVADVFRRIARPTIVEGRTFWSAACAAVHATVFSGQPHPHYDRLRQEVGSNIAILLGLLLCSHHLLGQHLLTKRTWYYYRRYFREATARMEQRRARCNKLAARARRFLSSSARQLVREYTATWQVKRRSGAAQQ
jgi:hypothetical protein